MNVSDHDAQPASSAAGGDYRDDARWAWQQSKEAAGLTERLRRSRVRWLRRNAVGSMRLALSRPNAPRRAPEELAMMLENVVLTFIEQAPSRLVDLPLGEPDLLQEALASSREMVELQVGVVSDLWSETDRSDYDLRRALKRLVALVRTRRLLVIEARSAGWIVRIDPQPGARTVAGASEGTTDEAIAAHVAAAWELNKTWLGADVRTTWRTRVANAREAVAHLRRAELLVDAESQIQQDLVYLLSGLSRILLDFADEDPGNIADALAASSEAVMRQAAILANVVEAGAHTGRLAEDAFATLQSVYQDLVAARTAAGVVADVR